MKKSFLLSGALLLSISAFTANAQQLPNVGFESWKTTCGKTTTTKNNASFVRPGVEPADWNGSNVTQVLKFKDFVKKDEASHTGGFATILTNQKPGLGKASAPAPAFLNFGTPWIFADTGKIQGNGLEMGDGGVYGGMNFSHRPDAVVGWYKRDNSKGTEDAYVIAYLWSGTFKSQVRSAIEKTGGTSSNPIYSESATIELTDVDRAILGKSSVAQSGTLIASCEEKISNSFSEWTQIIVPLEYKTTTVVPEKMNLIISAADYWNRANIVPYNTLIVDDVDFVYYSTLTSLTVGGETIALQDGVYNYNLKTDMPSVSKKDVAAVCKSQFADADVTIDNVNKQIKIVVTNQGGKDTDGATSHTYTLQYPVETTYQGYLNVKMGYGYLAGNDAHDIIITDYNDGTCDFLLPDLTVLMPLGDIEIKNMNVTTDASGLKTYSGAENNKELMDGAIIANVRVNGTIDAKGTVNMDVDVDWLYEGNVVPIKVKFTSSELSEVADGYYFIVKEDKSNTYGWATIKENQPTQLLVYPKSNGEGGADYRLTVKNLVWDGMLNGDFVVEGAAINEDENSNPVYFVENAPVSFMGGKTASVSVNSGYDMTKDPYEYDMKFNTIVDGTNYIVGFTTNQVSSSVNDVEASGAAVRGAEGAIVVEGFAGRVNVYTVDGRLAASAQIDGEATITVAAGLYVVRAGEKAVKVVVK